MINPLINANANEYWVTELFQLSSKNPPKKRREREGDKILKGAIKPPSGILGLQTPNSVKKQLPFKLCSPFPSTSSAQFVCGEVFFWGGEEGEGGCSLKLEKRGIFRSPPFSAWGTTGDDRSLACYDSIRTQ